MKILNKLIADIAYKNENTGLNAQTLQEAIDALYFLLLPNLYTAIDGGAPDSTFTSFINGGGPSDTQLQTIDGGDPAIAITILDGGSPSSN
jgi:hypothetical protein